MALGVKVAKAKRRANEQSLAPVKTGCAELVALALSTPEFAQRAGSRSNTDFVKLVYQNVIRVAPGAADLAYFTGLLDSGAHTQASLGVLACQTTYNTASAELVDLADTGIAYVLPSWLPGGGG